MTTTFDPEVMSVELYLVQGGFDPFISGVQDGFSAYKNDEEVVVVRWLPLDWYIRATPPEYLYEELPSVGRYERSYTAHLRESEEEEARIRYQLAPETYDLMKELSEVPDTA